MHRFLLFTAVWARWVDHWDESKEMFFKGMAAPMKWLVPGMVRKKFETATVCQGTGRHTRDEIYELGRRDLDALAAELGEKPFSCPLQLLSPPASSRRPLPQPLNTTAAFQMYPPDTPRPTFFPFPSASESSEEPKS